MRFFALLRKNPSGWMMRSTSSSFAPARSRAVGYASQSSGVTLFTAASVHWAESTTAQVRWKGSS